MNRWEKIGGYTQRGKKRTRAGGRCTIERLDDRGGGAAKWKSQIQWEGRKRKIESRTVGVRAEEMPNNGLS